MLRVLLVRHGESEANTKHLLGRCVTSPLTARGDEQAVRLGKFLVTRGIVFDAVFSSTAIRTIDTARKSCQEISNASNKLQPIQCFDEILEINRGDWDAKEILKCFTPEVKLEQRSNPLTWKAPGVESESMSDVELRMVNFLSQHVCPLYNPAKLKTIGIFSHGMAIRALLRIITQANPSSFHFGLNNTAICELHYYQSNNNNESPSFVWEVISLNDTTHLTSFETR